MESATTTIFLILLSIVTAVLSVAYLVRGYRALSRRLSAAHKTIRLWEVDYDRLMDRLSESLRKATAHVADENRDRLFWQNLFRQTATTLAERNKELQAREELLAEYKRLSKEHRLAIRERAKQIQLAARAPGEQQSNLHSITL